MPKTTPWREARKRLNLEEQAVARDGLQLRLAILREQVGKSQVELAGLIGTSQSNVSQLERSEDLQLSSIARYIHALGGKLQVNAVVGNTTYRLLDDVDETLSVKP